MKIKTWRKAAKKMISIRVPVDMHDELIKYSKKSGYTITDIISSAIENILKK